MGHAGQPSAAHDHGAYGIDEVVHRVDVGREIRPFGHRPRRCKDAAEQQQAHHEEPHHEDGLLESIAVVAYEQSER